MAYQLVRGNLVGDKDRLLAFWHAYGEASLNEKYAWIYEKNPDGQVLFWLLIHEESGEVAGATTLFPRKFVVDGQLREGSVAGDLLISPHHRSLGPAMMLQRAVVEEVNQQGSGFVVIYPNKNASLIAKRVGYKKVGHLARLVRPVSASPVLAVLNIPGAFKVLVKPLLEVGFSLVLSDAFRDKSLNFRSVDRVGDDFDQLWGEYSRQLSFAAQRSSHYMNWKYGDDPDDKHRFYIAENRSTGVMEACLVYRKDEDALEIRDFIPAPDSTVGRKLLRKFSLFARQSGASRVIINSLSGSEYFDCCVRAGFREGKPGRIVMAYNGEGGIDVVGKLNDGSGVMLMMSDEDT